MSRSPKSNVARLIEVGLKAVDKLGIDHTVKTLLGEIKKYQSLHNSDAFFIVSAVSEVLDIPEDEIFYGTGRKNERRYAVGFCAYFLHYVYKYDMEEVRYMLRKDNEWTLYKYSALIEKLNPQHNSDKQFIAIKELLQSRVQDHIKRNKKKLSNEKNKRARAAIGW
jgi:hypothetical protein